jgi:pyroglutamyl-peptidase
MATLLITGFEPFGHFAVNPSHEIVKHLSRNGKPAGAVTAILPVDAARVPGMITDLLLDLQPDLCLRVRLNLGASCRHVSTVHRSAG